MDAGADVLIDHEAAADAEHAALQKNYAELDRQKAIDAMLKIG